MKFRRLRPRKRPNYKRSMLLIILLLLVIYFWLNAEGLLERFLGK